MALNKIGDKVVANSRERIRSTDFNDLQKVLRGTFLDTVGRLLGVFDFAAEGQSGVVVHGLRVTVTNPVSNQIRVEPGLCLIHDAMVNDDGISAVHVHQVETAQNVTVAANGTANPRIDLVLAKVVSANAELETKDIYDTVVKKFTATPNTPKRLRSQLTSANGGLYVKQGIPAVSPTIPTPDANTITLARVLVDAGFVSIASDKITDRRKPAAPNRIPEVHALIDGSTGAVKTNGGQLISRISGGASMTFHSKPSAGRYRYTLSGFSLLPDLTPFVSVHATPNVSAVFAGATASLNATNPQLEVVTFGQALSGADTDFFLRIVDIGLAGGTGA